ncbi:MAG: FtsX-like permease family protein [Acidimicrobiales bacterium]
MSTALERPQAQALPPNGGAPARRAMLRWAWRLFRREWRQQLLIVALVVVAVGATVLGATVATNTPPPANAGFGTAQDLATFPGPSPKLRAQIAALRHRFGRVEVIEDEAMTVPGSIDTYDLRAQDPHGAFGQPMLALLSGRYPSGPGQVAVTDGVASDLRLKIGGLWRQAAGTARRVVGIVENPQSLLDKFALVVPGRVKSPTQVTLLFDAGGVPAASIGPNVETPALVASNNPLNPETIVLALDTLGMLLIGLVAVGGFSVLAQRRLRSIGMVEALGATDKHVRLVVRANGVVAGVVGTLVGAALGVGVWLACRSRVESSAHHLISAFALPWVVVVVAMVLAVVATFFAAARPAHTVTRIPIVAALSGRPAPPKQVHRSAVPGLVFLVIAFFLLSYSGAGSSAKPRTPELVLGLVALIPAVILLSPFCLTTLAKIGRRAPIAVRLALRDLARYRARSGSALAAVSLGVLIAIIIAVVAAARYGNVLDYAGPNLASNQVVIYTPLGGQGPRSGVPPSASQLRSMTKAADAIATSLGSHDMVQLESTSASLNHNAPGRNWSGPIYVATPSLLAAFGIRASQIDPTADILTMRPGLAGTSKMQLVYGKYFSGSFGPGNGSGPGSGPRSFPCPKASCFANPVIQTLSAFPSGTSAPNTVITEHAIKELHLQDSLSAAGWLIQTKGPLTASQIYNARQAAAASGMTIETKNSQPSSSEIINWATVFGIVLALGILAMTVGLIRSETAGDLRTLTATGASSPTRRALTAATAAALGLVGAVLGTVAGYVGVIGYLRSNSLNGGISALGNVPVENLLIIILGIPLIAAAGAWLLAGRELLAMARQPLE